VSQSFRAAAPFAKRSTLCVQPIKPYTHICGFESRWRRQRPHSQNGKGIDLRNRQTPCGSITRTQTFSSLRPAEQTLHATSHAGSTPAEGAIALIA